MKFGFGPHPTLILTFVTILISRTPAQAQGSTSTSGMGSPACNQAQAAEAALYSANMAALDKSYEAAAQNNKNGDTTLVKKYAAQRDDEDNRHAKALIDLSAGACSPIRQTGTAPCDLANYSEAKLYEQNEARLDKQRQDQATKLAKQILQCGSDAACFQAAGDQAQRDENTLQAQRDAEEKRHQAELAKIRNGVCSQSSSAGQSQGNPNPSTSSQSAAACYTPARGPACPPVRFGWGNCPNSKQACDWCYGADGKVFAYVPRGSTYSLASGCNSFGPGTIWATQSAQTAQSMAKAGGSCTPDGKGGYICSNVDAAAFKRIAGF